MTVVGHDHDVYDHHNDWNSGFSIALWVVLGFVFLTLLFYCFVSPSDHWGYERDHDRDWRSEHYKLKSENLRLQTELLHAQQEGGQKRSHSVVHH